LIAQHEEECVDVRRQRRDTRFDRRQHAARRKVFVVREVKRILGKRGFNLCRSVTVTTTMG
jgi:hypothetical protein